MKYKNPIIPGFHPDPSICRVGDDFYLVTSSFEYFPGIPIFHSKDLIQWEQIGHCITRNEQLKLMEGAPNRAGIFAPTIRYNNGIFYIITTNISNDNLEGHSGNFIIWTKDPRGEWSDPIWIDCPGIDPSLFFDDDGKVYYCGSHGSIFLCEIDIQAGIRKTEIKYIWEGSGGCYPEGPHIYKINGWYYLFISEGGTEVGHMLTVSRSKHIWGPYESYSKNPVLSNRSLALPIKAIGHADITEDQNGNWWAVCLGIRTLSYPYQHNLGRETMLVPMTWNKDGWPVMGKNGTVEQEIETDCLPVNPEFKMNSESKTYYFVDKFNSEQLNPVWNYVYNPLRELFDWSSNGDGITLFGNNTALSDSVTLAWLGRRQEHHRCRVRTELNFARVKDGEEAGLTVYMNNLHHYEVALSRLEGKDCILFRRQIGSLWKIENVIPCDLDKVVLEMEADLERYVFRYSLDGESYHVAGEGECKYLTTEVGGAFTGNYVGIYASGNGEECENGARFGWFEYAEIGV